jgi:hypothetical protein
MWCPNRADPAGIPTCQKPIIAQKAILRERFNGSPLDEAKL